MEVFAQGDATKLASLYTTGGQLLPPNSECVSGQEAIQAFWQGALNLGPKEATLETVELEAHGETAIEIGKYVLRVAGGKVADAGKYMVIWKMEGNRWKLHRDMWSSSAAPGK